MIFICLNCGLENNAEDLVDASQYELVPCFVCKGCRFYNFRIVPTKFSKFYKKRG